MRIALVCPYSLEMPGGVQGQVIGLAKALTALGHEAAVIGPGRGDSRSLAEQLGLAGDGLVLVGGSVGLPANGSVAPVALSPAASLAALRHLWRARYDVVHIHEPFAPGITWPILASSASPLVGTFHRAGSDLAYDLVSPLARVLARRLAVRCAVSKEAARTARRVAGGSYVLMGNGIDTGRFSSVEPLRTEAPTILFVGRHERRKGLEVLLEAFTRLGSGGAPAPEPEPAPAPVRATLWVAGEGPETPRLKRAYGSLEGIEWLGRIGDEDLSRRLLGADVLCAPSLGGESFGVVLLEALAASTVVVASDLPGYRDVVGDHALLVPPGDSEALRAGLEKALGAVAGGESSRATWADVPSGAGWARQWSMESLARRYADAYQSVVPASHRRARSGSASEPGSASEKWPVARGEGGRRGVWPERGRRASGGVLDSTDHV